MVMAGSNNEHIEVRDASIIKANEHHRFKIGDVINNGYGNFTVKGFMRSPLGLAYALDNGSKIIGWLNEQVDNKCHLVSRVTINENIPDKIYRTSYGDMREDAPITENDIEYIRKDELMDGAVDATVESDLDPHGADYGNQKLDIKWGQLESKGFKPGTKVKVIIIKEKEKLRNDRRNSV